MASIKISELNQTTQLNSDSLFVVVQDKANKKLAFQNLSGQVKTLIDNELDIDSVKSGLTEVDGKCSYISG